MMRRFYSISFLVLVMHVILVTLHLLVWLRGRAAENHDASLIDQPGAPYLSPAEAAYQRSLVLIKQDGPEFDDGSSYGSHHKEMFTSSSPP